MTQITVDRAVIADMLFASQSLPSCQAGAIVRCKCQVCAGDRARATLNARQVEVAAPVQRKPLTDDQIDDACKDIWGSDYGAQLSTAMQRDIARAIEAAHGITAHTIITDPAVIRAAFEADVTGDYSE